MKQSLLFLFICIFYIGSYFFTSPALINASGVDSLSQPGQSVIKNENGVMYVTTEVDANGMLVTTATPASSSNRIIIPLGYAQNITDLINKTLRLVLLIVALLVFMYLIWGGFDWITSGGDKSKTEAARQKIVAAVIGLIVVASSWAILLLVLNFLGFKSLDEVFQIIQ